MSDLILALVLAVVWGALRKREDGVAPTTTPAPTPTPTPTPTTSPSIPETLPTAAPSAGMPAGLPPFPSGWEVDEPVGPGVAARALALLPVLWAQGQGARTTEQTAGRWITYVAVSMGSKRGVVAYRPRAGTTAIPASTTVQQTTTTSLQTLRQGSRGPDVVVLQKRLGISADGIFGAGTRAAVIAYQSSHGLTPDGIVGPKTWTSLLGGQTA